MNGPPAIPGAPPLRLEWIDPATLDGHPSNWKHHPAEQLDAIAKFQSKVGWAGALLYNERTGRLLDGHGRKERFAGGVAPVLVGEWSEEQEREILAFLDPLGWASAADKAKVDELFAGLELPQADDPTFAELAAQIAAAAVDFDAAAAEAEEGPEKPRDGPAEVAVPLDSRWPSGNAWDVPDLLPELQATEAPFPCTAWGSQGATRPMLGTWHCYTDDSKFEPLWKKPHRILLSRPGAAVEPNFSTTDQTPFAFALWQVYRKRWVARWWQSQGLKVFVDLNAEGDLNRPHEALGGAVPNLLGVPRGWGAYATRAHADRPENLVYEHEVAAEHAADLRPVLFLVVGGGRDVKALCRDRRWIHVPEQIETRRRGGKEEAE